MNSAMNASTFAAPALAVFTFAPGMSLRVIDTPDGKPWFVAKDACDVLGYGNPSAALSKHVDRRDRATFNVGSLMKREGTPGGNPVMAIINEGGLYSLILSSKMPAAKEFKRWVTSVVLPAIRKDGAYVLGEEKVATGEMSEDELIAKAFTAIQRKAERLAAENLKLTQKVTEQAPAVAR